MVSGQMVCIGSPQQLKQKFGQEYVITIDKPKNEEKLQDSLEHLSSSVTVLMKSTTIFKFSLPIDDNVKLSEILQFLHKEELGKAFRRFAVSQFTLTDTFARIVSSSLSE